MSHVKSDFRIIEAFSGRPGKYVEFTEFRDVAGFFGGCMTALLQCSVFSQPAWENGSKGDSIIATPLGVGVEYCSIRLVQSRAQLHPCLDRSLRALKRLGLMGLQRGTEHGFSRAACPRLTFIECDQKRLQKALCKLSAGVRRHQPFSLETL